MSADGLERANAALREANAALARTAFARADSGGAAPLAALRDELTRVEAERDALRAHLAARDAQVLALEEIARRNDELFQQQRAWNAARRYREADRIAGLVQRVRSGPRRLLGRVTP